MSYVDILNRYCARVRTGVRMHADMADAFEFLGLRGFSELQTYRAADEFRGEGELHRFMIVALGKVPSFDAWPDMEVIPAGWATMFPDQIGPDERSRHVRKLFGRWVSWETETVDSLSKASAELRSSGELALAVFAESRLKETQEELEEALYMQSELEGCGWDMTVIVPMQSEFKKKYRKKLGRFYR